jgi:hypothetical protein
MATFSLNALMFGDEGIAHIPDIPLSDRARIFAEVVGKLFEKGHHLGFGEYTLSHQEMQQAIHEVKSEICPVFGAEKVVHGRLH